MLVRVCVCVCVCENRRYCNDLLNGKVVRRVWDDGFDSSYCIHLTGNFILRNTFFKSASFMLSLVIT